MKFLTPSYLDENHSNTLRYELCEIIYDDYKGTTFFLDKLLRQKKVVLDKVYDFFKNHPEIMQYKGDSKYWYPYENVDGSQNLSLYTEDYPNTDGEITCFCKEGEDDFYEYLFDPVKMHFFLMCGDMSKMDCTSDIAKEIIKVNNELFKVLFDKIGDTISYNGLNTLEHIQKYIQSSLDEEEKTRNNTEYSQDMKDLIIRDYRRFNDFSYLLDESIIICNADKLEKDLPLNREQNKVKRKI